MRDKNYHANTNKKRPGVAMLILNKLDSRADYCHRKRTLFHDDKGVNSSKECKNSIYMST